MNATSQTRTLVAITVLGILLSANGRPVFAGFQKDPHHDKIFAQDLVERTRTAHPEVDEIGISALTSSGCRGIASTDKSDIGEPCEKNDSEPLRTGKPFVERERDGFDVSLPLHDPSGNVIGTVGIGFRAVPGQTQLTVVEQARKIVREMENQIRSRSVLFTHSS